MADIILCQVIKQLINNYFQRMWAKCFVPNKDVLPQHLPGY